MSPFFLNYGYHPWIPFQLELGDTVPAAKNYADTYAQRLAAAKAALQAAQARMHKTEDQKRRDVVFEEGQQVLLSTKNLTRLGSRKLMPKWIGPFPIEKMINPVAARFTLPEDYRFHNVFTFHS